MDGDRHHRHYPEPPRPVPQGTALSKSFGSTWALDLSGERTERYYQAGSSRPARSSMRVEGGTTVSRRSSPSRLLRHEAAREAVAAQPLEGRRHVSGHLLFDHEPSIADIAAGKATYNKAISRYEINGRTYGVEDAGRTFPDSGTGLVKLDANEYAALQQIVKAKGDLSAAPQLTRNPRFTNNPGIVEKALAIYNGTYR